MPKRYKTFLPNKLPKKYSLQEQGTVWQLFRENDAYGYLSKRLIGKIVEEDLTISKAIFEPENFIRIKDKAQRYINKIFIKEFNIIMDNE
jgi:hypothetical protein